MKFSKRIKTYWSTRTKGKGSLWAMMWSLKSTRSKVLRPLLLVYVQPIYHLQGLGWTEGAGTWWPGTPWCGPSRRRCTASRASPPPSCPPRSHPSARSPGLGPGPATLAKRGQPRSSCNMTSVICGVLLSLHCGYLHMRGDLMETVVSVFINDIRSVERNFFVWIDAHQEGRDWCLQNLSDLKQYFRLLSQWLRVWLKPKHFFQINSFINECWKPRCYLKHFHTPMFVTKHTHGATVIFNNIYIDLVSFEARVQVVHQGLLRHRLQAAQVVHSQLAVAGGRSTGPTRTSRFWNRKCVIVF